MENKLFPLLLLFGFVLIPSLQLAQENEAPNVKITSPSENAKVENGSIVPYSIAISDKEDGNSEYDEINSNEVVLTVTYFSDSSEIKKYIDETVSSRSNTLSTMASSNCFTCHKAKDKLIGPSLEEIANRYGPTLENKKYLTQKIRQGSAGVWSDELMPAQPELEEDEIMHILDWIFKNAKDPNYDFYVGVEGVIKIAERPKKEMGKASYVLHAQYTDHGTKNTFEQPKRGTHTIILNME